MPLPNGLYKLALQTPEGTEYGVAVLQDGRLRGGDSGMAYIGSYRQEDDAFAAEVVVTPHWAPPGMVSALGYNGGVVQREGESRDPHARMRGASKDTPGLRLTATLSLLAD